MVLQFIPRRYHCSLTLLFLKESGQVLDFIYALWWGTLSKWHGVLHPKLLGHVSKGKVFPIRMDRYTLFIAVLYFTEIALIAAYNNVVFFSYSVSVLGDCYLKHLKLRMVTIAVRVTYYCAGFVPGSLKRLFCN